MLITAPHCFRGVGAEHHHSTREGNHPVGRDSCWTRQSRLKEINIFFVRQEMIPIWFVEKIPAKLNSTYIRMSKEESTISSTFIFQVSQSHSTRPLGDVFRAAQPMKLSDVTLPSAQQARFACNVLPPVSRVPHHIESRRVCMPQSPALRRCILLGLLASENAVAVQRVLRLALNAVIA